MEFQVSKLPQSFLDKPGKPSLPWSRWYREFNIFAVGSGWKKFDNDRKEAFLLNHVGQEARRLYFARHPSANYGKSGEVKTEQEQDPIPAIVKAFEELFPEKRQSHTQRMLFRRCVQQGHQSAEVYVADLQELSGRCEFGNLEEQMICDQFIEGCKSDRLREKLCRTKDLTIKKLLEVADVLDVVHDRQHVLAGSKSSTGAAMGAAVAPRQQVEVATLKKSTNNGSTGLQYGKASSRKKVSCFNCGGPHLARDSACPARGKNCHDCNMSGHYAKFCRKKSTSKSQHVQSVQVLAMQDQDSGTLWKDVLIEGKLVRMVADTGSGVSIIPASMYLSRFKDNPLKPASLHLHAYGGTSLPVQGVMHVTVQNPGGGKSCQAQIYVVNKGTPLLGRDLMKTLEVSVHHGVEVHAVHQD